MIKSHMNAVGVIVVLTVTMLAGCGKSSSTTPTAVPNSATIFYAHNLVFKNETTLMSTGYNGFGQLGSGNLGNRTALGLLSAHYPFSGFATGGNHSVAFINNSTVRTWGYNGFGQLGNNSTTHSSNPVPVFANHSGTVNLTGVKAVAAGAYHTFALKNDDTLWAWGQNYYGQLGVDYPSTPLGRSLIPVKVNSAGISFSNISSITANGYHSLARANGFVWAWGFNGSGQLGIDPSITGAMSSPIRVYGLPAGIVGIASGGAFNYAVANDGTVWAWGDNDYGQLGNGTLTQNYMPSQVLKSAGTTLTGVVQVAAGIQHGLARLADGTVWAWGYNFFNQLGDGTTKDSSFAVKVSIPAGESVTDIRAFGSSSMAKVSSGWYVWGDNYYGQLGLVTTGKVALPVKMQGL